MSEVKGVNKTLIDAGTTLAPGLFDGRIKCMVDSYEASTLVLGSTITVGGRLTKGCVILMVWLTTDALGGSTTMSVGDAESAARYMSAEDTSSAASHFADLADGVGYTTDETDPDALDTQIVLTTAGASMTGTIKIVVAYTND